MSKEIAPRLKKLEDEIESLLNFEGLLNKSEITPIDDHFNKKSTPSPEGMTDQVNEIPNAASKKLCTSEINGESKERHVSVFLAGENFTANISEDISISEFLSVDSNELVDSTKNHTCKELDYPETFKFHSNEKNQKSYNSNSTELGLIEKKPNPKPLRKTTLSDFPENERKISSLFPLPPPLEKSCHYKFDKYTNKPIVNDDLDDNLEEISECNSIIITRNDKLSKIHQRSLTKCVSSKSLFQTIPEETANDGENRLRNPNSSKSSTICSYSDTINHHKELFRNDKKIKSKLPVYINRGKIKPNKIEPLIILSNNRQIPVEKYKHVFEQLLIERKNHVKTEELLNNLCETIEKNRKEIADLKNAKKAAIDLAKTLEEKCKQMKLTQTYTAENLQRLQDQNEVLLQKLDEETKIREKLLCDIKQKVISEYNDCAAEKVQLIKNMMCKREKLMQEQFKSKLKECLSENDHLKKERDDLESKITVIRKQVEEVEAENKRLTNNLEEVKDKNENFVKEKVKISGKLLLLEGRVEKLFQREQELQTVSHKLGTDLINKTQIAIKLHSRCRQMENNLKHYLDEDAKKVEAVELELRKFVKIMKEKEKKLLNEREQLLNLVYDLREAVKIHKQRTEDLLKINKQQKSIIKTQQEKLQKKDNIIKNMSDQAKVIQKENQLLNERIVNFEALEETLNLLKSRLCEQEAMIKAKDQTILNLQNDLENYKKNIDNIKDTLLVQEKIIEDQANTIKKLKNENKQNLAAVNDYQKIKKSFEQAEYKIRTEKKLKEILKKQINHTNEENCRLHNQLEKLQTKIEYFNNQNKYMLEKHNKLLSDLEKQVEAKQKQWNDQRENLAKEKDQAILAAKYASKKLYDTVTDFQNQIDKQKKIQNHLSSLLDEKENCLNKANEKIKILMKIINGNGGNQMEKTKSVEERLQEVCTMCSSYSSILKHMNL